MSSPKAMILRVSPQQAAMIRSLFKRRKALGLTNSKTAKVEALFALGVGLDTLGIQTNEEADVRSEDRHTA